MSGFAPVVGFVFAAAEVVTAVHSITIRPSVSATPRPVAAIDGTTTFSGVAEEEPWDLFGARPDAWLATEGADGGPVRFGLKDHDVAVRVRDAQDPLAHRLQHPRLTETERMTAGKTSWLLTGAFLFCWSALAVLWSGAPPKTSAVSQTPVVHQRDPRWDRLRFHLMTIIIWTHWVGKWGMETTKAGWVVLNWGFAIHVISFVFLSGVFSQRYAVNVQKKGLRESIHVVWNCLDIFLVYLIFSWMRGLMSLTLMQPQLGVSGILLRVLKGTFLFHQAPWYLSALIVWRLSVFVLWRIPGMLMISLCVGAICPYAALQAAKDPFALREVMHYMPFFALGLACGEERFERIIGSLGSKIGPAVGMLVLVVLAVTIAGPLGPLFGDPRLRWVLLKKDVPPPDVGGYWLMMLLYLVKTLSMTAAMVAFVAPTRTVLDRAFEKAGQRSMMVYMVHMVFIMVPGEWLCDQRPVGEDTGRAVLIIAALFVLAVAVNLLCGSDATAFLFRPLMEPLSTSRRILAKAKDIANAREVAD
mmetsp:Transcript_27308/g.71444  ORF Transcript_27308/g.71444 Transcript_27308/m.71444 type:complete len:529 (+) Transcript_27308:98-1684(+)